MRVPPPFNTQDLQTYRRDLEAKAKVLDNGSMDDMCEAAQMRVIAKRVHELIVALETPPLRVLR